MKSDKALKLTSTIQLQALSAQPFLKWVGGKRMLLPQITKHIPKKFGAYAEPFLGGAALFFALNRKPAFLSDLNSELITTYRIVRDNPADLIRALSKHKYDKDYFYKVRELRPETLSPVEQAARMIYLNRVGFNGLYRVNSRGEFNVPFGRYTNPKIVNQENIYACSDALKGVIIENLPFQEFPWNVLKRGDFVYFDPPYVPLNKTSNFTDYTREGFGVLQQEELAEVYRKLDSAGVQLMLSNSSTTSVEKLFKGFRLVECFAPRFINSKAASRGPVREYLVLNY